MLCEKNAVINLGHPKAVDGKTQILRVPAPVPPETVAQFLDKAQKDLGAAYFKYSALNKNNCQDFVRALLRASGALTPDADKFLYQDLSQLVAAQPAHLAPVADAITDLGARVDRLVQGGAVDVPKKKKWTPPSAQERAAILARRDELEAARLKREAAYAASNPQPIFFEGTPEQVETIWYPGHGRKSQAEHEADAKKRFEDWERTQHPVRAGLRVVNDELATFARKHLNPGGILSGILPEPSGLHQDHPLRVGAKVVAAPLGLAVDAATGGLGGSGLARTLATRVLKQRMDGGAVQLSRAKNHCPKCDAFLGAQFRPKTKRAISDATRAKLVERGKLIAAIYAAHKGERGWTKLTDASTFLKDVMKRRSISLEEARDLILG